VEGDELALPDKVAIEAREASRSPRGTGLSRLVSRKEKTKKEKSVADDRGITKIPTNRPILLLSG